MTEETPESSEAPASEGSAEEAGGPIAEFKALPAAEKILAISAVAVLLGFLFSPGSFGRLFKFSRYEGGWFNTLAFVGSVGCIIVICLGVFGVKLMGHGLKIRMLIGLAVLPALGFVIDELQEFWGALMLAGAVMMGYVAAKISTREKIIKVKKSEE